MLEGDGHAIYFGGDTVLIPEWREFVTRFPPIGLTMLSVNGPALRSLFNREVVMDCVEATEEFARRGLARRLSARGGREGSGR